METYRIDIEAAMKGAHSATLVAALVTQMPKACRWRVHYDSDMWWDDDRLLMAALVNHLRGLVWGMGDPKKRGPEPKPIGPSWAKKTGGRKLPAVVMSKDELLAELAKPRIREVSDAKRV